MDHIGAALENTKRNIEVIGEDLVTRHGFTQVPNFILTNEDLSVGAKLYYAMLLKYAREKDHCYPGQGTIAADMGSTDRSVRTSQQELEEAGFPGRNQRGLGKTNHYKLDLRVERGGKVRR